MPAAALANIAPCLSLSTDSSGLTKSKGFMALAASVNMCLAATGLFSSEIHVQVMQRHDICVLCSQW